MAQGRGGEEAGGRRWGAEDSLCGTVGTSAMVEEGFPSHAVLAPSSTIAEGPTVPQGLSSAPHRRPPASSPPLPCATPTAAYSGVVGRLLASLALLPECCRLASLAPFPSPDRCTHPDLLIFPWFSVLSLHQRLVISVEGRAAFAATVDFQWPVRVLPPILPSVFLLVRFVIPSPPFPPAFPRFRALLVAPGDARGSQAGCAPLCGSALKGSLLTSVAGSRCGFCTGASTRNPYTGAGHFGIRSRGWKG